MIATAKPLRRTHSPSCRLGSLAYTLAVLRALDRDDRRSAENEESRLVEDSHFQALQERGRV